MSNWTQETKEQAIQMYLDANPTPETSTEIIKDIADELDESPNGVRMILIQSGKYIKRDTSSTPDAGAKPTGTKRVSKESSIAALTEAIRAKGAEVDEEILSKLTGKAAVYLLSVINT